jgi:hypothetical protein
VLANKFDSIGYGMLNFQAPEQKMPRNQRSDIGLRQSWLEDLNAWPHACFLHSLDVSLISNYTFYLNFAFEAFIYTSAYQLRFPVHHTWPGSKEEEPFLACSCQTQLQWFWTLSLRFRMLLFDLVTSFGQRPS